MADFFTRVPGPLEVMRRLGLNVPSSKQVGKFFTAAPEFVGPQADVAGMVRDAGQVMPNIRSGDYGQALGNLGMAAAAIPFMAIPGTVTPVRKALGLDIKQTYPQHWDAHIGGKQVGSLGMTDSGPYVANISVEPHARRQGIASEIYKQVEEDIGRKLIPSPMGLSDDATAFWKKRLANMPEKEAEKILQEALEIGERQGVGKSARERLSKFGYNLDKPKLKNTGTVSQVKGVTKKVVDEPKKRVFHGSGSDYEGVPKATRTADDDFTGVSVTEDRGLASTYGKNIKEFEIKGKLATFDDLMDAENSIARKRGLLSAEDIGTGKSLADIDDPNYFQTMQKVKDELLERGFVGIDYEGSLPEMLGGGHGIRVLDPKALRKLK